MNKKKQLRVNLIINQWPQLYLTILLKKSMMNELHESVDKNKLYFEYIGPAKDVSFYEYYDSKELFDEIKNNRLRFDDAAKKQKELLKKINDVKIGKKNS